ITTSSALDPQAAAETTFANKLALELHHPPHVNESFGVALALARVEHADAIDDGSDCGTRALPLRARHARRRPPPSRPDRAGDPHATEKERPDKKAVQIDRADARIRTADPFITSEVLYQLSYVGGGLRSVPPISQFDRLRLLDPLGDAARVGVVRSHVRDL